MANLLEPTPPTPNDPETFPVMIQVFHNIHCLNLIRKAVWRDYYPDSMDMLSDGTVNRTSPKALHIGKGNGLPQKELNWYGITLILLLRSLHQCNSGGINVQLGYHTHHFPYRVQR
jgi:hypothetical protein